MRIISVKTDLLKEYENNPRKNEKAIEMVKKSIEDYGFRNPILIDKNNVIVAGHTRLKAAKELGYEELPCILVEDLTEEQIKAYRIVDNKTNEFAEWDYEKLEMELASMEIDLSDFGLNIEDFELEQQYEDDSFDIEEAIEKIEEPKTKYGEVYQLGKHRLMCGDATKEKDVKILMNGDKADLLITDPPYNVDYKGNAGTIKNDNMKSDEFKKFLTKAFKNANSIMREGASYYIWFATREHINFELALKDAEFKVSQELIWNKNALVMGRSDYQWKHEPCLYGWKEGIAHTWNSDRSQTTVLEFDKQIKNDIHPTMKPLKLFDYQIRNSTYTNDKVVDLFGGSGTTLIACEENKRKSYTMELDPKYADVIIKRWEELTGEKAVKICEQ